MAETPTPNITHPGDFEINGIHFRVVSDAKLTERQAAKAALHFFCFHRFRKADKGRLFTVNTEINSNYPGPW